MKEGWVCPKCGRVYGPMMMTCAFCNNKISKENAENEEQCKETSCWYYCDTNSDGCYLPTSYQHRYKCFVSQKQAKEFYNRIKGDDK